MSNCSKLSIILFCLSQLPKIFSDIVPYHRHIVYPNHPEYLLVQKYDKNDAPHWSPGHGKSFIDLSQLNLKADCSLLPNTAISSIDNHCEDTSVNFQILMFEAPTDQAWIDYWPDRVFCCNNKQLESDESVSYLNS